MIIVLAFPVVWSLPSHEKDAESGVKRWLMRRSKAFVEVKSDQLLRRGDKMLEHFRQKMPFLRKIITK
ncbi:hypothetical protein [Roseovarius marisflavi]|uniref:hypothetical protein n=1 Tax=Roseovarius marisflavi TaxID=1054996 RepID=UPI001114BD79|nr:hypothetical protein [Roseovarius marisflavi]